MWLFLITIMVTSVTVFLDHFFLEAVLPKAFNVIQSTQGEWRRDVVTVCSREGTFTLSGSATQLTMLLVGGRVGEV